MEDFVIKAENVTKEFKLPHEKSGSVKSAVVGVLYKRKKGYELQRALDDVSFEIKKGDFFGIVGRNGSGKSTLLKLLAGIYSPTSGQVHVRGTLTPFIELGVGFNPELTGRENVFLNGALLGFNRKDMRAMYKDIISFAEIEKFMDQKLKNYSSGMQVRLAFSIAIRATSDILMLDEVLAVGDEAFQQKCIDVFEKYKAEKRTVVLVTHDMEMIRRFCNRAILINDGHLIEEGDPRVIAAEYTRLNSEITNKDLKKRNDASDDSQLTLRIVDSLGKSRTKFNTSEEMTVIMKWPKGLSEVKNLGIAIHKNSGEYIFGDNTLGKLKKPAKNTATYKVKLNVGPGSYHLVAGLFGETESNIIRFIHRGPEFIVESSEDDKIQGLVRLKSDWDYES